MRVESDLSTLCCTGDGEVKCRNEIDPERVCMSLEVQPALRVSNAGIQPLISLRLFTGAELGDRPHIDTRVSAIELSVADARQLARWLTHEVERFGSA